MCHTAFSVRLTSLMQISLSPLLLSVCLALDFIQDQESVRKGPLGAQNTVLIACLIVGFFL